jgi:hypothetical protein
VKQITVDHPDFVSLNFEHAETSPPRVAKSPSHTLNISPEGPSFPASVKTPIFKGAKLNPEFRFTDQEGTIEESAANRLYSEAQISMTTFVKSATITQLNQIEDMNQGKRYLHPDVLVY